MKYLTNYDSKGRRIDKSHKIPQSPEIKPIKTIEIPVKGNIKINVLSSSDLLDESKKCDEFPGKEESPQKQKKTIDNNKIHPNSLSFDNELYNNYMNPFKQQKDRINASRSIKNIPFK